MNRQKILFIRPYSPFIEALKDDGYEVVVLNDLKCNIEKMIWSERPGLILLFVDGLEFDGVDPVQYIPLTFKHKILSVSSALSQWDLLKEVRRKFRREDRNPPPQGRTTLTD